MLAASCPMLWLRRLGRTFIGVSGRPRLIEAAVEFHLLKAIGSQSVPVHGVYESAPLLVLWDHFLGSQGHSRLWPHCELSSRPLRQRLRAHCVPFGRRLASLGPLLRCSGCSVFNRVRRAAQLLSRVWITVLLQLVVVAHLVQLGLAAVPAGAARPADIFDLFFDCLFEGRHRPCIALVCRLQFVQLSLNRRDLVVVATRTVAHEIFFVSDCCHESWGLRIGSGKLLLRERDQAARRVRPTILRRALLAGLVSDWGNSGRIRRLCRRAPFLDVGSPGRPALDFLAVRAHVCVQL